jgi:hypothetical protein
MTLDLTLLSDYHRLFTMDELILFTLKYLARMHTGVYSMRHPFKLRP